MESLLIANPPWIESYVDWDRRYWSDEEKMQLAIDLSRENIVQETGGPFGAVVFEIQSGRIVGIGVNSVVRLNNCTLHGEMMAFMMAQASVRSFSLDSDPALRHELVTSCEPCAMCLGAALWSGVHRIVAGAASEDARAIGFDEGPVFPESYAYLGHRRVEVIRGLSRDDARQVLWEYAAKAAPIYNGEQCRSDGVLERLATARHPQMQVRIESLTDARSLMHKPITQEQAV